MRLVKTVLSAVAAMTLAACDSAIYDYDNDCREGMELKFVFDYNMEWADAFASKVHCLTVLVYDGNGNLVESRADTSDNLRSPGYSMVFDLPAGSYRVVAYGGMACPGASFVFDSDPSSVSDSGRTVSLATAHPQGGEAVSDLLLHDHFYGTADIDVAEPSLEYTCDTVKMMRNTNNFRIMLQQINGEPLSADDFTVRLSDDNVRFAADNSLLPTADGVVYEPWSRGSSAVGTNDSGEDWMVAHYDLSTSRLIVRGGARAGAPSGTSGVDSPRLVISRADGSAVADLPILNYLLLMKGDHYYSLGNQEFLDRQSDWNIMLFLDRNLKWISTHIVVNDWVVRINDIEQ